MATYLDQLVAARQQQARTVPAYHPSDTQPGGTGVFGFLGNLLHGGENLVTGLAGIGGQVLHDVGRGAAQVVPGQQQWGFINDTDPTGYHLDNIVQALPGAVAHDYATRYGSLGQLAHGLYHDPLSYILDALSVGSAIGKGAEFAGSVALRDAPEAAAKAADVADELRLARVPADSARAAGIKAGLDELAKQGPLTGLQEAAQRILPSPSARKVGNVLVPYAQKNNPVARAIQAPALRLTSEPLDVLREQATHIGDAISGAVAEGQQVPEALTAQYGQLKGLISGAEQAGLTRIQKPFASAALEWNAYRHSVGEATAAWLRNREGRLSEVVGALRPYYRADASFGDRSSGVFQGLDVNIPALQSTAEPWANEIASKVVSPKDVALVSGGVRTNLNLELSPEIRAAANPAMVDRVDELVKHVQGWVSDRMENPAKLLRPLDPATMQDAANRYVSGLYDVVRRRVMNERGTMSLTDTQLAQDDMRLVTAGWQRDLLDKGDDIEHIMERTYRPLEMKYGAKMVDGLPQGGPDWRTLDDSLRAANVPQPVYFPYLDAQRMQGNFWDFLMNRSRIGARRASADKNLLQMKGGLLTSGNYVTDPIEAYSRRAARAVKAEEVQNLIDHVVKPVARRISSTDEVMPGEALYAPDGLWRQMRNQTTFNDLVDDGLSSGLGQEESVAQALGHVVTSNHGEMQLAAQSGRQVEMYAIPKLLARQLDSYARWSGAVSSPLVRLFWDKPSEVWRSLVLQGSPRWVLNNLLGNTTFFATTGGGRLSDVVKIAEERFKAMLNERFGTDLNTSLLEDLNRVKGMERVGGGFSSKENLYSPKLGAAGETATGQVWQRLSNSKPMQVAHNYGSWVQRFNGSIESAFREASYLKQLERTDITTAARPVAKGFWDLRGRLSKMADTGYSEGQVQSALSEMNKVMGDYGSLGPFERNVVRRFIFPFWGFYKHQAGLLARLPVDHPLRSSVIRMLGQVNNEMLQQYGPIPEWLQGAVPLGPPGPEVSFLSTRGPNPFSGTFQTPLSMLNPALQLVAERSLGENLYTGQPFQGNPHDFYQPYGSDQVYQYVRDKQGNVVDAVPVQGHVEPPLAEQILGQIPQYTAIEGALAGGKKYDTDTLLSILRARAAGNPAAAADLTKPTSVIDQLLKLSGLGSTPYDIGAYQQHLEEGRLQALKAAGG